jgi:hypothetical protein
MKNSKHMENKIEGTPILKLAIVKRFKVLCNPKVKSAKVKTKDDLTWYTLLWNY